MIQLDKKELRDERSFYFRHEVEVRFQDVDAAGVVFFATFFDYVHQAYESLLGQLGSPLPQVLAEGKWAAPLRHVEADYFQPANYGDLLGVALVRRHIEETELTLGWRLNLANSEEERVIAVVQTVHTFIHPARRERVSVPEELVRALVALPGENACGTKEK